VAASSIGVVQTCHVSIEDYSVKLGLTSTQLRQRSVCKPG